MKVNLKRYLVLLVAVMMLLGLAACGKDSDKDSDEDSDEDVTGKYICIAIAEDGVSFIAHEGEEQYVKLEKGGKGEIYTDLAFEMTWELDGMNFTGSYKIFGIDAPITGTLKDNVLEIHDDNIVMRYLKEGAEMPDWAKDVAPAAEEGQSVEREDATDTESANNSNPLVDWWNGDWYGCWNMYGCKGSYEEIEVKYWDCEAHIDIDAATYTGTIELWDDEQYQNMGGIGLVDVSLSENGTGEHGTLISEGGWFEEKTLSHADWIIDPALSDYKNMITITGDYDDGQGNSYYFTMTLRHWGELWEDVDEDARPWSYEDWYKPMIEDGVTKMSVRFGDPDPGVYEELTPGQNEDAENSQNGNSSAEYGKSNAAATGEVNLETLKSGWETIRNSDNKYELLYEDVRDLMGCDGEPYKIDGAKNVYCWQNGNAILTVTFKVLEDGNEELDAIAATGLE